MASNSRKASEKDEIPEGRIFSLPGKNIAELTNTDIFRFSTEQGISRLNSRRDIIKLEEIELNNAVFLYSAGFYQEDTVKVTQSDIGITISCTCGEDRGLMCFHETAVLLELKETRAYSIFFDKELRNKTLKEHAEEFGLETEEDLSDFFGLTLEHNRLKITPKNKSLLSLNEASRKKLQRQLAPKLFLPGADNKDEQTSAFLLFGNATYGRDFYIRLYESPYSKEGKPKNPVKAKNVLTEILETEDPQEMKMYSALSRYQQDYRISTPVSDLSPKDFYDELKGLRAILNNPIGAPIYEHDPKLSENIKATSIVPLTIEKTPVDLELEVHQNGNFYEITGTVEMLNKRIPFENTDWPYRYFLRRGKVLVPLENYEFVRVLDFFRTNNNKVILHQSKFEEFRNDYLSKIESGIRVNYRFLKPASPQLIERSGLNVLNEKIIYLSESDDFVLVTPVVRYGDVEIPAKSRRQLLTIDQLGNSYAIERNLAEEEKLLMNVSRMHPDFEEQPGNEFYFLHRKYFLDENWFLDTFQHWNSLGYTILGFSALKENRLNQHKASVSTHVSSELDWFDMHVKVKFGDQEVRLKDIQKSVTNRSKYVKLGDGTLGVLPDEWLDRFSRYFRFSDLVGDLVRVHKSNFDLIRELYQDEVLSEEVRKELKEYDEQIRSFERIHPVDPPAALNATLRDYQREGLNWLCFLDDFGFGGCLADDMGLGKTIQIIAFILKMQERHGKQTSLVVVPTSLIFNWQQEVKKFAPSLKILTIHGNSRVRSTAEFEKADIVLTTYGTLVSDILTFKKFHFQAAFLDESQAIKNPDSQRYKAVRLISAKNRIVLTGTPVENNTFDLYAQMSFAVPGLFGSVKRFRDDYAMPIDKFKDPARARELQKRIQPFLLRRTKKQVASELPEKTEMIVYCEMGAEQRRVYETYKTEFQLFLKNSQHDDLKEGTMHILQGLTKLRQICNSPALLSDEEWYGQSSAKLDELVAQITSKSPQHKILVFSQFVGMLDLISVQLKEQGIDYCYLTGKTKDRQAEVERFQNSDDMRVFLISLKAGGTGLNLTEADYVFIVDPWWNPAVENQAIDRAYRIGQQKHVMAVRLICPDTIEEKIMLLQSSKRDLVNDLIHTDLTVLKSLDRQDLLHLLD